jgi:hypothetical protein
MSIDVSVGASTTDLDGFGSPPERLQRDGNVWYAELSDGVRKMSSKELDEAFRSGVIDAQTMVLKADAPRWTTFGDLARSSLHASSGPADTRESPSQWEPPYQTSSIPPMATDIGPELPALPLPPNGPARVELAFGAGSNDSPAELRARRVIFAGVLVCALACGFFAATGTAGLRSTVGTVSAALAGKSVTAPEAASPSAQPEPSTSPVPASAVTESKLPAPPPTGVARSSPPMRAPASKGAETAPATEDIGDAQTTKKPKATKKRATKKPHH